jgi:hypothetical protein
VDDVAQGLISRHVAPVQFPFRDLLSEMVVREGPSSASLKEGDLTFSALVDPVDNFAEAPFIGVIVMVTVGVSPNRLVACEADTRPVRDPSRPIGPV